LELRAGLPEGRGVFARQEAVRHVLALGPDPEEVRRRFSKMHQRNIRKAEGTALEIRRGNARADLETFYRLHLLTRRRLGVPIQPRRFFRLLADCLLAEDRGFVLSAHLDGAPIAAAVFLTAGGTMVYKYGASDQRYWEHRPNNLLFWAAIRWGCEAGYRTFDWGRTDLEDEGLRGFKTGWGAREEPLVYTTIADAPPRPGSGRAKRALGDVIRRSPPLVCQILGETLYRYAA
ncbi:MAG: GNAT family N-acetyltransferase, partial [Chloroflexota bacterium]|nr:GNAT family N-acetyltransferase [Chloroflexota bacterium]